MTETKVYACIVLSLLVLSCSHNYDPDTLNLDFYQWNLWQDSEASPGDKLPSCGWEDLHRGMGKLVRIPAPLEMHFPHKEASDVFWYHCRFTLPEQWEEKPVSLVFVEAGPWIDVFLNEEEVASMQGDRNSFEVDVRETIFYTRDNHLSIRISSPPGGSAGLLRGITGTIMVKPDLEGKRDSEPS